MLPPRRWRAGNPWQVRRATELVLGIGRDDTLPENTSRLSGSHRMNRRRAFCTISTSELLEIDESEDQNARWQGAARVAESAPLAPGRGQGEVVGLYVFHRPDRGDSAWEPDVGKAVNRRSHDSSLGVAYLKAGSSARAELGGGIANGSERAQDQEFALRKSESGIWCRSCRSRAHSGTSACLVRRFRQVGQVVLDLVSVQGSLFGNALRVSLRLRDCALRQRQLYAPGAEHFVDRRYRVERAREPRNVASWYTASRISTGATPRLSAPCVCDVSCGNVWRHASTMTVISSRVSIVEHAGLEDVSEDRSARSTDGLRPRRRCRQTARG